MKATFGKIIGIITIIATLSGCGNLGRIFGHEVIDTIKDEYSTTEVTKVSEDEYIFTIKVNEEGLAKMSDDKGGISEVTMTFKVNEERMNEFIEYMDHGPALSF